MKFGQIYVYSILMFTKKNLALFTPIEVEKQTRFANSNLLSFPLYMKESSRKQCYFKCTEIFNKHYIQLNINENISSFKKKVKEMVELTVDSEPK